MKKLFSRRAYSSGDFIEKNKSYSKRVKVAVCGQPNVGKSTLFNVLTNRKVLVANWPGVTVEKYEGSRVHKGYLIEFTDLPGIYGLYSNTIEERIARNYILSQEPDVILVLVDSTIPERTFNLALQLLELTSNVIVIFTKVDETHRKGIHINFKLLEKKLNTPVAAVSAVTNQGIDELIDKIIEIHSSRKRSKPLIVDYGELEPFINSIVKTLENYRDKIMYPLRWIALKILEEDLDIESKLEVIVDKSVLDRIKSIRNEAESSLGRKPAEIISTRRFQYIYELFRDVIVRKEIGIYRESTLSKYLYNPYIGSILGFGIIFSVFFIAFTINTGFPLNSILRTLGYVELADFVEKYSISSLIEELIGAAGDFVYSSLGENIYTHIVVNGILSGFGAVFLFLPLIMIVSITMALLEDSGLAPRIAVSLHTLLSKIGVSGYAVFPILLSLGCNVPGLICTRSVPDERERLRLLLTLSFIPCQARLVVLLALSTATTRFSGLLVIILGYITAFTILALINKLAYSIDRKLGYCISPELLMEIPSIHKPIARVVWWLTWSNTKHFLVKAGVVIFSTSLIIWFLTSFSINLTYVEDPSESIAYYLSRSLTPLLNPVNIASNEYSWILVFSLLMGFIAKEVVVSTLLISTGTDSVREAVEKIGLNDEQLVAYTLFTILYVPCLATVATIYSETRSLKYTALAVFLMLTISYTVMVLTYNLLSLLT